MIVKLGIKVFSAVALIIILSLPFQSIEVYAQNEPESYANVVLWIYPEYDDPRLLVMLEGQIEGTEPPAEVKFLVPSTAEMYSAGSMDAQGNYSGGPPDRKPSSIPGWDEISYQVTTDTFRVEYYDSIILGDTEKTISYTFHSVYPVSDMEIIVQEPLEATEFAVSPQGNSVIDVAGFNSYLYRYTDLDPDTAVQIDISYTRTTTLPSLSLSGEDETSDYTLIVIILAIIVLTIVAVFIWQRRTAPVTRAERRRVARKSSKPEPREATTSPKFCSQCGNPVDKSHVFCPNCGTKIQ